MKPFVLFFSLALILYPQTTLAEDESKNNWRPEDSEQPLKFGVGFDFFTMDQPYSIKALSFSAPGLSLPPVNTSAISVQNEVKYMDIKLDAWILPYLNLFAILGKVDGTTTVDLATAGLPLPISKIKIDLDGKIYGAGATLAIANERFFGTLTTALTNTNLKGGFDSSLQIVSVQPRAGFYKKNYQVWLGGFYLNTDEKHTGTIPISIGGPAPIPVNFNVTLNDEHVFSPTLGGSYHLNKHFSLTAEAGFGERKPILANLTYRIK
jgi:hypothetical protein